MDNKPTEHKRRVRYSGTHPKKYSEKYKEHNPEKYGDTISKDLNSCMHRASRRCMTCC